MGKNKTSVQNRVVINVKKQPNAANLLKMIQTVDGVRISQLDKETKEVILPAYKGTDIRCVRYKSGDYGKEKREVVARVLRTYIKKHIKKSSDTVDEENENSVEAMGTLYIK